jgi:hypothetical protein
MNDEIKQVLKEIRKSFEIELAAKTGWGRREVLQRYDAAVTQGVLNYVSTKLSTPV